MSIDTVKSSIALIILPAFSGGKDRSAEYQNGKESWFSPFACNSEQEPLHALAWLLSGSAKVQATAAEGWKVQVILELCCGLCLFLGHQTRRLSCLASHFCQGWSASAGNQQPHQLPKEQWAALAARWDNIQGVITKGHFPVPNSMKGR